MGFTHFKDDWRDVKKNSIEFRQAHDKLIKPNTCTVKLRISQ